MKVCSNLLMDYWETLLTGLAHHCMRGHASNKIMQDFYHPNKMEHGSYAVPLIMGLTASPVVRSDKQELQ